MVYRYCKIDKKRWEKCTSQSSHKSDTVWCVDIMLGGRNGKRIRERKYATQEIAQARDRELAVDFQRGKLFIQENKEKLTFSDIADRYYMEHCMIHNRNPEKSTKYRIELAKSLLGRHLIHNVSRSQLKELQNDLSKKWNPATVNRFFNMLRAVFYKAMEWDVITKNPCEFVIPLPIEEPLPRFLEQREINKLRATVKDQHLLDYMTVLLHTGARPSSIKACTWDNGDVDLNSRTIWFTTYKGRKIYRYSHPIDDSLYELLMRRATLTKKQGKVFETSRIDKLSRQAIKESGINDGKQERQKFTIYGLKHCYASHLLMSGATIFDVAKLLGHTDTKMVMKHYGHLTQDYLRKVQAKVNLTSDQEIEK